MSKKCNNLIGECTRCGDSVYSIDVHYDMYGDIVCRHCISEWYVDEFEIEKAEGYELSPTHIEAWDIAGTCQRCRSAIYGGDVMYWVPDNTNPLFSRTICRNCIDEIAEEAMHEYRVEPYTEEVE